MSSGLNYKEVKAEYDGHYVLFDHKDFPPEDDTGYVVAVGDETDEDRKALRKIQDSKYHGKILLMRGWRPKKDRTLGEKLLRNRGSVLKSL